MSEEKTTTGWQPDAHLRGLLETLVVEEQKQASSSEFARLYLPWTESVWTKMKRALLPIQGVPSYFEEVSEAKRTELIRELEELPAAIAKKRAQREQVFARKRLKLSHVMAITQAVKEAQVEKGVERCIVFVAPTGGGKTELKDALLAEFGAARALEATRGWRERGSYKQVMRGLAAAVEMRGLQRASATNIESAFEERRKGYDWPVIIDEAEFMGNDALFAVRFLCNKTRLVPVLLVTPEGHADWEQHFNAAYRHIARRCHAQVEVRDIPAEDAEQFFDANAFGNATEALELIRSKAAEFGHFSLINRVAKRLHGRKRASKAEVEAALKSAKAAMLRDGGGK